MTHIRVRVPIRDTGCCARARALRPRLPRARCAAVAPRAHHAVTGARHRFGVAYARRPPLRDAGRYLRRPPPRWDAGRLRSVGLFTRVDAAQAAALARGSCAHRCGDGRPSPSWCCVCPPAALAGCRSVFAPPAPQVGCWSAPLRRPLCEGRRGPGRCSRSRPLRSSMR